MKLPGFYFFPAMISLISGLLTAVFMIVLEDVVDPLTVVIGTAVGISFMVWLYLKLSRPKDALKKELETALPTKDSTFLGHYVLFYRDLSPEEKIRFEKAVKAFLFQKKITPIDCDMLHEDRLLVAAAAAIPAFGIQDYDYPMLDEVLIYPQRFNSNYSTENDEERPILGMVGNGAMNGKMILSLPALRASFLNVYAPSNVGIHEFTHLLDGADGTIDGMPNMLLEKENVESWRNMIQQNMQQIKEGKSDINPYGATNQQEFFAVTSEYFFSRPDRLKRKHPELYGMLSKLFKQDVNAIMGADLKHLD